MAEKLLNIHPEKLEEIPDDLQITIERKPDFLKKVLHKNSRKDYILHIEFQTEDESKMVYRMHEYYGILLRKYELDIHQYVFFIGTGKATMPVKLKRKNLDFAFDLLNLQDFDYKKFIQSDKPEEVILAILANFGTDKPTFVVQAVLQKLKSLPTETLRREKCVKQLEVLSNLRNLQSEIIKQLGNMALTYDLEKDIRFQQGKVQGIEQGIEQGKVQEKIINIQEMLKLNLGEDIIAKSFRVSVDFVKKIAENLKSSNN